MSLLETNVQAPFFTYSKMATDRSHWSARVRSEDHLNVMQYCPARPYLELSIPFSVRSVCRVTIITVSHDQGLLFVSLVYLKETN